jgi:predicted nucleic acid-binding protein
MNLLIDTNIALYLLGGDSKLAGLLDNTVLHLSFVSELELLSYPDTRNDNQRQIEQFIDDCLIIDITIPIKKQAVVIRKNTDLKMSDALIAGSAVAEHMPFLSADKDFERVDDLHLFTYEV